LTHASPFDGSLGYARCVGCPANRTALIKAERSRLSVGHLWPGEYRGRQPKLLMSNTRRQPGQQRYFHMLARSDQLPDRTMCGWSDLLRLKYVLPKIWSQSAGRSFGIYWSDAFSYGRLWPEPTSDELNSFYELPGAKEYLGAPKEAMRSENLLSRIAVKIAWLNDRGIVNPIPTILSMAKKSPEVCDIGCGVGMFLSEMQEHGATVTGVDPSPLSAEAIAAKNIEFHFGVAESLPPELSARRFDVVTMLHCLTCCRDPVLAVSKAASLLKPDGLLVIEVSNMDCLGFLRYGPAWWHTDAGRNLHFFTKKSLVRLLDIVGAKPVKWEYRGFVTQFTPGWIETMGNIWNGLEGPQDVPRPSLMQSLAYLPRALVSSKRRKYEAIRVYARSLSS
jgi:2-polyprenyl-3-methyl-5-hydroxy-6-metoxy-1,4-benzoquinol methylase